MVKFGYPVGHVMELVVDRECRVEELPLETKPSDRECFMQTISSIRIALVLVLVTCALTVKVVLDRSTRQISQAVATWAPTADQTHLLGTRAWTAWPIGARAPQGEGSRSKKESRGHCGRDTMA